MPLWIQYKYIMCCHKSSWYMDIYCSQRMILIDRYGELHLSSPAGWQFYIFIKNESNFGSDIHSPLAMLITLLIPWISLKPLALNCNLWILIGLKVHSCGIHLLFSQCFLSLSLQTTKITGCCCWCFWDHKAWCKYTLNRLESASSCLSKVLIIQTHTPSAA